MPTDPGWVAKAIAEAREWFGLVIGGVSGGGLLGWLGGVVRERRRREERMVQVFREEGAATRQVMRESMRNVHTRLDGLTVTMGRVEGKIDGRKG